MNIGPFQVVYWGPRVTVDRDDDSAYVTLSVRRPHFWAARDDMHGVFRWRIVLGWIDVRRFATDAEMAEHLRKRGADDAEAAIQALRADGAKRRGA